MNDNASLQAPWRLAVDVGGTFTDLVLADAAGSIRLAKVPSTPDDPSLGVLAALDSVAEALNIDRRALLSQCDQFVHGTTVGTNILVQGLGAKTGLLVTRGFRDFLEIRRGIRENAWDHRQPYAPVLVPRYLRLPLSGRIDREGREIEPLVLKDVAQAARVFEREAVRSVAICLFNSFLNDSHERAAEEELRRLLPDVKTIRSAELAPIIGEYERGSTSVVNAVVAPDLVDKVEALNEKLQAGGLPRPILMVQNNGGSLTLKSVPRRPAALLLSGPAAGVGALRLCGQALGHQNLLSMEIGGTSCDVMLMRNGEAELRESFDLGGYHIALSSVDIHSIGAGGGTLAAVDSAGMIQVGPRGAGASPGPAAYGRGGDQPTVTDAQLVLGRLAPGPFGQGDIALDKDKAVQAIEEGIARNFGLSVDQAAAGILRLVEQQLAQAVEQVSLARGHDPRRFVLVAGGGAGPMHASAVARQLGCEQAYIPRHSGVFCALGMLLSPVRHELARVHTASLDGEALDAVGRVFDALGREAEQRLQYEGFRTEARRIWAEVDLRHPGQQGSLRVPCSWHQGIDLQRLRADFFEQHDRLYGHSRPEAALEVTALRVIAEGIMPELAPQSSARLTEEAAPFEEVMTYFPEASGRVATPVYRGRDLGPGLRLTGPLLVREATTTLVVGPNDRLEVDEAGNFVLSFVAGERDHG